MVGEFELEPEIEKIEPQAWFLLGLGIATIVFVALVALGVFTK